MTKRQLDRILREFPWLWGIQDTWSVGHKIVIRSAEDAHLDMKFVSDYPPRHIWVYSQVSGCGVNKLSHGEWRSGERLACRAISLIPIGCAVVNIAYRLSMGPEDLIILRNSKAHRDSLHSRCLSFLSE